MKLGFCLFALLAGLASTGSELTATTVGTAAITQGCTISSFEASSLTCTALTSDYQAGFTTPSQAAFSGVYSVTGATATFSESGYASAGTFKGYVSESSVTGTYPIVGISGGPESGMIDILTFSDPSLNETAGSLILGLSLDSTTNVSGFGVDPTGSGEGLYAYAGPLLTGSGAIPYSVYDPTGSFSTEYTGLSIPFVWGDPVTFEILFAPIVEAACNSVANCSPTWNYSGPAYVNALDTAVLNSLNVYNANGNLVPSADWKVTSASGLDYTSTGIVPEPSSYAILALVLGVFALCHRAATGRKSV